MVAGGVNERIRLGYGGQAQGDDEAKECESDLAVLAGKHDYVYSVENGGMGGCAGRCEQGERRQRAARCRWEWTSCSTRRGSTETSPDGDLDSEEEMDTHWTGGRGVPV